MRDAGDPEIDDQLRKFGQNIRASRQAIGFTQIDLANAARLDRAAASFLERGERSPDLRTLIQIANAVAVSIPTLLEGVGNNGKLNPATDLPNDNHRKRGAFATNLRAARTHAGLSQEALAHNASVDRAAISAFECDHRKPNLRTVLKLARTLQIAPGELLREIT